MKRRTYLPKVSKTDGTVRNSYVVLNVHYKQKNITNVKNVLALLSYENILNLHSLKQFIIKNISYTNVIDLKY